MPPREIPDQVTLEQTSAKLYDASGQQLEVLGKLEATVQRRKKYRQQKVYMVNGLEQPLLERNASSQLGFIQLLCTLCDRAAKEYCEKYPELFRAAIMVR